MDRISEAMTRKAVQMTIGVAAALLATLAITLAPSAASAAGPAAGSACAAPKLSVAGGCVSRAAAVRRIGSITRATMSEVGIRAAILQVDSGGLPLLSKGFGNSMAGVPATPEMHFRIGSMAIPYLITLLLQLEDEGRLKLDDKLSRFLPQMPDADRITLRQLAYNTSGYADWIQGNPAFAAAYLANPFRQWSVAELLSVAFASGPVCEPGTCFHYAHTNYAVLSEVISKVTGESVDSLMHSRIFKPLGLRQIAISRLPAMPGPVLHAYVGDRGGYEDSTFWSPSWTIGAGTVMSGTIGDIARTAEAVGTGALLSPRASRQRFAPAPGGLTTFAPGSHYGLGIVVANGWSIQNPMLNGYTGVMAYLPRQRLAVAIVATARQSASASELPFASVLFEKLTAYLSPGNIVVSPR
jgi:D-alanyl-D-alanine carboxypeptidase